ncbi:hypothetical protein DPMN_118864 [Dreissena polymorpha]|uniref:CCHC-type domain-containing protein n=2 Tax=Dreissena polymorpha TaxID=45954 RepID=A0A9D4GKX3_DREPO|nr:hypothetical protein DPMN_118864 [Dreissena polymorpha]
MASRIIDVDTASFVELKTLPNVGDKTAQSIINLREEFGYVPKERLSSLSGFRPTTEFWRYVTFSKQPPEENEDSQAEQTPSETSAEQPEKTLVAQPRQKLNQLKDFSETEEKDAEEDEGVPFEKAHGRWYDEGKAKENLEAYSHDMRTQTPEDKNLESNQYWQRWGRSQTPEDRKLTEQQWVQSTIRNIEPAVNKLSGPPLSVSNMQGTRPKAIKREESPDRRYKVVASGSPRQSRDRQRQYLMQAGQEQSKPVAEPQQPLPYQSSSMQQPPVQTQPQQPLPYQYPVQPMGPYPQPYQIQQLHPGQPMQFPPWMQGPPQNAYPYMGYPYQHWYPAQVQFQPFTNGDGYQGMGLQAGAANHGFAPAGINVQPAGSNVQTNVQLSGTSAQLNVLPAATTVQPNVQPAITGVIVPERENHAGRTHRQDDRRQRLTQQPKALVYSGKGSWKSFKSKFNRYVVVNDWSEREKKDYLCLCLTDTASDYHTLITDKIPGISYNAIMEKMERRFGCQELPETAMIKFSNACQQKDELLDDWADRVMTLATHAFRDLPDEHMNRQTILRFCHGLVDKHVGEGVANMRPITMEEAIDKVKWAKYTRGLIYNKQETITKGVVAEVQVAAVTAPKSPPGITRKREEDRMEDFEKRFCRLEEKVNMIAEKLEKLSSIPRRRNSPSPSRSPSEMICYKCNKKGHLQRECPIKQSSAGEYRSRSPENERRCYNCQNTGHWRKDCPELQRAAKKDKQVSFVDSHSDLNSSGSESEA